MMDQNRLVIVGNSGGTHIGESFLRAALQLKREVRFCSAQAAFQAPAWVRKCYWRLGGHQPVRLRAFGRGVVKACRDFSPRWIIGTGFVPLERRALESIGAIGIHRVNYLTDDPCNPTQRSRWFLEALPSYDHVFSVRRSNLEQLRAHGCKAVDYLPFGFDPELFYPVHFSTPEEETRFSSDVVFAGGADRDRVPYIVALIRSGFQVTLYGNYWERFSETRALTRGLADPATLRLALGGAKVALGLVRQANRDGNSMRTFEIPAVGVCMLTEDTQEHREIFGEQGKAVVYFHTLEEMVAKLRWLLDHDDERKRLAKASHQLIIQGRHTYKDRLVVMLGLRGESP